MNNLYTASQVQSLWETGCNVVLCGYTFAPVKPTANKPPYTLKPLKTLQEIVDAVLAGKTIMHREGERVPWSQVLYPRSNINIQELTTGYFAEQVPLPKTMWINGVEVPAPLATGRAQVDRWVINFTQESIYQSNITASWQGKFWATKEDAEAVLAAILKPFKELEDA